MKNEENFKNVRQKTEKKNNIARELNSNKFSSNQNGITLIALVLTIIILIILAAVSMESVFGKDGLIKRAQDARNFQTNSELVENQFFEDAENFINDTIDELKKIDDKTEAKWSTEGGQNYGSDVWNAQ